MLGVIVFILLLKYIHGYTDIDLSSCGTKKACLKSTSGCDVSTCVQAITWTSNNGSVEVELLGVITGSGGYIAIGFSLDNRMGEDSVIGCFLNNNVVVFRPSYNPSGYSRNTFLNSNEYPADYIQTDTTDPRLGGKFDSTTSRLYCRFRRKLAKPPGASNNVFDLNTKNYYIFMARGSSVGTTGLDRHNNDGILLSSSSLNLAQSVASVDQNSYSYPLVKAHGCFMIFAWVTFAFIGIVMAGHFKDMFPNTTLHDKAMWFVVHVICQSTCVLCVTIGFIIIFIHVGGYSTGLDNPVAAHPILGIIVFCLTIINPIMAGFRCEPNHPRRPIFNFFHLLVGTVAYVLALITIILGLRINKPGAVVGRLNYPLVIMVSFSVIQLILRLILIIHPHLTKTDNQNASSKPGKHIERLKNIIGGIHALVALSFGLCLVVIVAVN